MGSSRRGPAYARGAYTSRIGPRSAAPGGSAVQRGEPASQGAALRLAADEGRHESLEGVQVPELALGVVGAPPPDQGRDAVVPVDGVAGFADEAEDFTASRDRIRSGRKNEARLIEDAAFSKFQILPLQKSIGVHVAVKKVRLPDRFASPFGGCRSEKSQGNEQEGVDGRQGGGVAIGSQPGE